VDEHDALALFTPRLIDIANTVTTTSALRGLFLHDRRCRREFLDFDAKNGH
jgi:GTP cyclohydrolase I